MLLPGKGCPAEPKLVGANHRRHGDSGAETSTGIDAVNTRDHLPSPVDLTPGGARIYNNRTII